MAGRRSTSEKIQVIRDFTAHWGKIVARRALEDAGPDAGFAFQAMEDLKNRANQVVASREGYNKT